MKILYFDTETTGTSAWKHDITQFAAIIEIDGVVKEEVNFRCQPTRWENIDPKALETTGVSIEQLRQLQPAKEMFKQIKALFDKYIPKYTKMPDKFYPAGHNVQFDLDFLNAFFKTHGSPDDQKWGITSYQNWRAHDSRVFGNFLGAAGKLPCQDMKLGTLCDHFGIEINAHDALSDIRATRAVVQKMMAML
jgi:DNA polymerase-3 subunit epsilon